MSKKQEKKEFYIKSVFNFLRNFAKIGRTEPQKVAPKQSKELSVNSGTKVTQPGTRDARRQFRDCPGHSGTVGSPRYIQASRSLSSLGEHLKSHLKYHTTLVQGPEIHGKSRKISLLVGEAQLAGCSKV